MRRLFKEFNFSTFLLLAAAVLGFSACSTDSDDGNGTLRVMLTDAPAAYNEVNIEVEQVLVHRNEDAVPEEDGDGENDDDDADENGEWHVILDESMTINLLDYQNGETLELGETELEAGQYSQIRLMLGDDNTIVVDGETYALTTPSAQQSGYKLNVNADIEEGEVYELIIDFDASQSIVATGAGGFLLKPVLRTVDFEEQGSIAGTVMPIEAEPFVYAIHGQDTVGTQPDDNGNFQLTGLEEGTYDVLFAPTNDSYVDSLVQDIVLEDAEDFEFEATIELEEEGLLN
ncbi:DUF4382 domain-containing protein [Gracilimonas mengyeensis]|uniref:DUF4382 domain-containing protein n=1 Tax=Gracilimonas mengyeensis TaxID=1302730 RepID=A0A521BGB6_9BACT|nr:DUF4382 domain-containing protein [Gracilimonas mengyeensis]SMO46138.1 protein of unknown function [Gracilimonas mengyeensis]